MNEYKNLYFVVNRDTDSQSSFKHLVYGLRKLYRLNELDALHLTLPGIKRPQKLPVIFSTEEIKRLLKAPSGKSTGTCVLWVTRQAVRKTGFTTHPAAPIGISEGVKQIICFSYLVHFSTSKSLLGKQAKN